MKRPLHLAFLALMAGSAAASAADWLPLAENPSMRLTLNPSGRKVNDGSHIVQYRIDLKSPQKTADGKTYQSSTMTVSVSCTAKTVALTNYAVHGGAAGSGEVVSTHKVAAPVANKVVPSSSDELVWNAVCSPPQPAAAPGAPAAASPAPAAKPAAPKK